MPAVPSQDAYTISYDALHGFSGSLLHALALTNALPSGGHMTCPGHTQLIMSQKALTILLLLILLLLL